MPVLLSGRSGLPPTARCRATSITALSRTRPRPDGVPGLSIGVPLPPRPRLRPDGRSTRPWSAGPGGFYNEILTRFGRGVFQLGRGFFSRLVTVMAAALPSEDEDVFAVGGLHPRRARGFRSEKEKAKPGASFLHDFLGLGEELEGAEDGDVAMGYGDEPGLLQLLEEVADRGLGRSGHGGELFL